MGSPTPRKTFWPARASGRAPGMASSTSGGNTPDIGRDDWERVAATPHTSECAIDAALILRNAGKRRPLRPRRFAETSSSVGTGRQSAPSRATSPDYSAEPSCGGRSKSVAHASRVQPKEKRPGPRRDSRSHPIRRLHGLETGPIPYNRQGNVCWEREPDGRWRITGMMGSIA